MILHLHCVKLILCRNGSHFICGTRHKEANSTSCWVWGKTTRQWIIALNASNVWAFEKALNKMQPVTLQQTSQQQFGGWFQTSCIIFPRPDPIFENHHQFHVNTWQWSVRENQGNGGTRQRSHVWPAELLRHVAVTLEGWPCAWPLLMDELRWPLQHLQTGSLTWKVDCRGWQTCASLCVFIWMHFGTVVVLTFCCSLTFYCYLPLKVKHSSIVLWELISCWYSCCYCCCCCESRYSACTVVLIL